MSASQPTSRAADAISLGTAAATLCVCALLTLHFGLGKWWLAIALAAVGALLSGAGRRFHAQAMVSAVDIPLTAGVLLLPPGPAVAIGGLCGVLFAVRPGLVGRATNLWVFALPIAAASLAFLGLRSLLAAEAPDRHALVWLGCAVAAAFTMSLVNLVLAGFWLRYLGKTSLRRFWVNVVGPLVHAEPIRALLVAAVVEIALLLDGSARLLPVLVAVAGAAGAATYLHSTHKRVETLEQKAELTRSVFLTLARVLEMKDPETAKHSARVAMYCWDISAALGLDRAALARVHLAGLLHDVGKVGISDEILFKPGKLTPSERRIMEDHARLSAEALAGIPGFGDVARTVYAHQESWDGSGYPEGLRGEEIPLAARVIAVADAFEAITSDRPYRAARSPEVALEIIREASGTQFDPRVVEALAARVEAGSADYRYGSLADFGEEWARATEGLEIDSLDQEAREPFVVPQPRAPQLSIAEAAAAAEAPAP
jgi:hypothetical protein